MAKKKTDPKPAAKPAKMKIDYSRFCDNEKCPYNAEIILPDENSVELMIKRGWIIARTPTGETLAFCCEPCLEQFAEDCGHSVDDYTIISDSKSDPLAPGAVPTDDTDEEWDGVIPLAPGSVPPDLQKQIDVKMPGKCHYVNSYTCDKCGEIIRTLTHRGTVTEDHALLKLAGWIGQKTPKKPRYFCGASCYVLKHQSVPDHKRGELLFGLGHADELDDVIQLDDLQALPPEVLSQKSPSTSASSLKVAEELKQHLEKSGATMTLEHKGRSVTVGAETTPAAAPPADPLSAQFESARDFVEEVQSLEAEYGKHQLEICRLKECITDAKKDSDFAIDGLLQYISAGTDGLDSDDYIAEIQEKYREVARCNKVLENYKFDKKSETEEAEKILGKLRVRIRGGIDEQGMFSFHDGGIDENRGDYPDRKSASAR